MENVTFSFGENWLSYIDYLNDERIEEAKKDFLNLLKLKNLKNKTFLDIGCGSGIFSYSALKSEAEKVCSLDVDINSVKAANKLKELKNIKNWEIIHASVLDNEFIKSMNKYNIVYSWGVLHHTGKMWDAIRNAASLTDEKGIFVIAIYNKTKTSEFWLKYKRLYNKSNKLIKKLMELFLFIPRFIVRILKFKNPMIDDRGMNIYHDAIDWAGGLPYEYASFNEIVSFVEPLGFKLINSIKTNAIGCNQFVFSKK